jgi:hypothetical protein
MAHGGSSPASWTYTASAVLLAAALLAPAAAQAGPSGRAELRAGLQRFDYSEYRPDGGFLDGEAGFLPALSGALEVRSGGAFLGAAAHVALGSVRYDGHAQSSSDATVDGLAVRSTTDAGFVSGEVQLGAFADAAERVALFVALGARRWTRDIRSSTLVSRTGVSRAVAGLSEIYSWYELQLGARWAFLERGRTSWDAEARFFRTAAPEMSVDLGSLGGQGSARLALGPRTGWRAGSTLRRDLQPGLFLAVTLYAEGYAFGASDAVSLGGASIFEPRSETFGSGLEVGLGGRF